MRKLTGTIRLVDHGLNDSTPGVDEPKEEEKKNENSQLLTRLLEKLIIRRDINLRSHIRTDTAQTRSFRGRPKKEGNLRLVSLSLFSLPVSAPIVYTRTIEKEHANLPAIKKEGNERIV